MNMVFSFLTSMALDLNIPLNMHKFKLEKTYRKGRKKVLEKNRRLE